MELQIEYLSVNDLTPYDKNARKHQSKDVDTIKASIKQFGMSDPIGVWSDKNIVVEGHGRLQACKELGIDKVPVIHLDHLSDEQRRAYALAHNKTAEMSEWDFDILGTELDDIFDIDMSDFGFDLSDDNEPTESNNKNQNTVNFNYQEQYGVIVMCKDEQEQESIYNRLVSEGFDCKVVAT